MVVDGCGVFGTGAAEQDNGGFGGVQTAGVPVDEVEEGNGCGRFSVCHTEFVFDNAN